MSDSAGPDGAPAIPPPVGVAVADEPLGGYSGTTFHSLSVTRISGCLESWVARSERKVRHTLH